VFVCVCICGFVSLCSFVGVLVCFCVCAFVDVCVCVLCVCVCSCVCEPVCMFMCVCNNFNNSPRRKNKEEEMTVSTVGQKNGNFQ